MSPTEGTGRMPRPSRYRLYSALVQLVPRGMGAHTSSRKARPSVAMAAGRSDAAEAARAADASHKPRRQLASVLQPLAGAGCGLAGCPRLALPDRFGHSRGRERERVVKRPRTTDARLTLPAPRVVAARLLFRPSASLRPRPDAVSQGCPLQVPASTQAAPASSARRTTRPFPAPRLPP